MNVERTYTITLTDDEARTLCAYLTDTEHEDENIEILAAELLRRLEGAFSGDEEDDD